MQQRKRVGIIHVDMVSVKTTERIMNALLEVLSNIFMWLRVCLCFMALGVISNMIAVNVFVAPQVRLVRFQAYRT